MYYFVDIRSSRYQTPANFLPDEKNKSEDITARLTRSNAYGRRSPPLEPAGPVDC
jgi:hypothetical protein